MNPIYILLIIAVVLGVHFGLPAWRKWRYSKDLAFFAPTAKRPDLLFGYFSCMGEQVAETKDHINLLMETQFSGPDKCIQNILDAGVVCMLDVCYQVFSEYTPGQHRTVRPDADPRLRDFFTLLQSRGALKHVRFLSPIDEPNNTVGDLNELFRAVVIIKAVASEFRELDGYKLAVIYAADKPFIGQEMFDLIGFDDYDMKSHVLVGSRYQKLRASLLPHQRIMIIPGGAYGQDPVPFVNFAQANAEVAVVMPFLWFDDSWGNVGAPGIRSNATRALYVAAGKSVIS